MVFLSVLVVGGSGSPLRSASLGWGSEAFCGGNLCELAFFFSRPGIEGGDALVFLSVLVVGGSGLPLRSASLDWGSEAWRSGDICVFTVSFPKRKCGGGGGGDLAFLFTLAGVDND